MPDRHATLLEERDGGAELIVGRDLKSDREYRRLRLDAEQRAQFDRIERQRVVLGIAAQKDAAVAAVGYLLGHGEAEELSVVAQTTVKIAREQAHGPGADDLEGTGHEHAIDIEARRAHGVIAMPR